MSLPGSLRLKARRAIPDCRGPWPETRAGAEEFAGSPILGRKVAGLAFGVLPEEILAARRRWPRRRLRAASPIGIMNP